MGFTPLPTKLHPPPPCQTVVNRPRLSTLLAEAESHPVTLVSAPPGYGKTTLIASWLRTTSMPWGWLSLEDADDDPVRFLQYLLTSLQTVAPTIHTDLIGLLQGSQPLPDKTLVDLLVNGIAGVRPFFLVLDDFHCIHEAAILDLLAYLLDHLPPPMHLVILTRVDPLLQLAQLRVRNELLEIRGDQLCFTSREAGEFLNQRMNLALDDGDIEAMEARTEGWIAGLHLAALSMRGAKDPHESVTALAGTHHYIMDYLVEQVLRLQPAETRDFLLQTSILGSMCGELCSRIVPSGVRSAADGQAMLEALDRMNLFIVPLDDDRRWYRYHNLFADVLNRSLERQFPERVPGLHQRASLWYEESGLAQDAIQHALLAGDRDRAVTLIEQNGCGFLLRGEVVNLLKLIDAVEPYLESHAWMGVLKAWALGRTGRPDQAEQSLRVAEGLLTLPATTVEGRTAIGSISAARAHCANLRGDARLAAAHAQQALEDLPDASTFSCSMRGVATTILGDASFSVGDLESAKNAYAEAARIAELAEDTPMSALAKSHLAGILLEQGSLRAAAHAYEEALALAAHPDGGAWPLAEDAHVGLAIAAYEWNLLEQAEQHVRECLRLCSQWGATDLQSVSEALLARTYLARGDPDRALDAAKHAEEHAGGHQLSPEWSARLRSTLVRLWLEQGRPEKAASFIHDCPAYSRDKVSPVRLPEYISLARLQMVRGDLRACFALCDRLLEVAESTGRTGRVIEILILKAMALWKQKETEESMAALRRALTLAQGDGYVRAFLDEGPAMARLLQEARSPGPGAEYATELLAVARKVTSEAPDPASRLIEPPTPRELEVLQLIKAGCSNQEIASRLVISPATLKRHITNLYAKLGVGSRTQALSAARVLKLID
jgi:LuxR family maltose regulon positive regulatory protein